jgi:hypothetical protein
MRDNEADLVKRLHDRLYRYFLNHGGRTVFSLDGDGNIPASSPVCDHCRHLTGYRRCAAFAGEIPLEIWNGGNTHQRPYPGDHGLQFEPRPGAKVTTPRVTRE